ncbi:MAG TPA: amidohydrolase family protein [Blastocatellia bacterium]|jgi:imidazolonepropionase-like amidohydrolase
MLKLNWSRPLHGYNPKRRGSWFVAAFVCAAMLTLLLRAAPARSDGPDAYAIKDAQIVVGNGRTIPRGTVVFRGGLITGVGENVKIPADARIINGTGMTVYPGLIDAFTSIGLQQQAQQTPAGPGGGGRQAAQPAASAVGQQPSPEASHGDPSLAAADQVRPNGQGIEDTRSVGVTSVLTTSRQGIFPGQGALINLAGDERARLVLRTPVALTVQFRSSSGFFTQYPNSLMGTVAFIRQSFYDAVRYRDEMERYNRVKRGIERPEYDKKLAALQPALRGEVPVLFVANNAGDVRRALMIADEFKLRPIIAGSVEPDRSAAMIKAKNVPVILSVDFPRRAADLPEDEDEPLRLLRLRAEAPKGPAHLARAGVKFAFSSGTLRPQDFLPGVQRAVENGLPKEEAIRALTINAAEILGAADQLGTIEEGKIANLVVTSGDLFARDTRIRHLFIDGNEVEVRRPEAPSRAGGAGRRPAATASGAAANIDPAGEWQLTVRTPAGDMNVRLQLRREGDQISGMLVTPQGNFPVRNAVLTGNQLRFTASVQVQADTMDAAFTATIDGDNMQGAFTLPAHGTMEFTGTRPR